MPVNEIKNISGHLVSPVVVCQEAGKNFGRQDVKNLAPGAAFTVSDAELAASPSLSSLKARGKISIGTPGKIVTNKTEPVAPVVSTTTASEPIEE